MDPNSTTLNLFTRSIDNPDSYLTVMDITAWEKQHGRIPYGAVVIMNSGFYKFYDDDLKYYGWEKEPENNMSYTHFPGFSAEVNQGCD